MRTSFPVDGIVLDREGPANLPRQLYGQLRALIEQRVLSSGQTLPSTREMARELKVGRNTVIAACDQLALEGYLMLRPRTPPVVMNLPSPAAPLGQAAQSDGNHLSARGEVMLAQPYHHGKPGMLAFHPGMPDPVNFPFNTWSKLLARRAKLAQHDLFGTYHVKGYPPLCEAIARYLKASRGVRCDAEQVVVTNGAQSAFDLLARLLIDEGDTAWVEEPGYYGACSAFVAAGARLAPLGVGEAGWDLQPPAIAPRLIFVTPSCHHPLGVTMPMEQRLNLIHMAEAWNSWIIEDDFDGEYRFQGQPIPALQGISASNRVVYVGTFAKILFPAMRLGFMVVPEPIRDSIVSGLSVTGQFAPLLTQAALADFMNEGHFTRHLRSMRTALCGASTDLSRSRRPLSGQVDAISQQRFRHPGRRSLRRRRRRQGRRESAVPAGHQRFRPVHPVPARQSAIRSGHGLRGGRPGDDGKGDAKGSKCAGGAFQTVRYRRPS